MRRFIASLFLAGLLSACAGQVRTSPARPALVNPAPPAKAERAIALGIAAGPEIEALQLTADGAERARTAFAASCPALLQRQDNSGLTRPEDWRSACAAATADPKASPLSFFAEYFEVVRIGTGASFVTGYYEPEILASRTAAPGYSVPIYKRPTDLIEADLGLFSTDLKGKRIRGRVQGDRLIPYADRAEIESGWLKGRGLELAWAADAVDFFFLQVQGSGRLKLPDGSVMRIGYDGQNGREYVSIGRLMRERGLLRPEDTSMQGIVAWLRANPDQGRSIMQENKSWVFFRELTGPGPLGAMGLPVTSRATLAADPRFVPLGAPVLLETNRPEVNGLWVAQDTGGAIKGANRFDSFWGAEPDAHRIAGGMAARGSAYILLPRGSLARLTRGATDASPPPQP
jgi:membrane-bound lytic murein transglycosylase A